MMKLGRVAALVGLVVASLASGFGSAGAAPPWGEPGPPPPAEEPDPALDVLGTWGSDMTDPDGLCVSILVPGWVDDRLAVGQEIADAFGDWEAAIAGTGPTQGLPWTDDTGGQWDGVHRSCEGGDVGPVDVSIEVRRGGGRTQGTTQLSRNGAGAIVFADIEIKGRFVGPGSNSPQQIGLIARHEIGHGLGLGHWNVDGQLMSSFLVDDPSTQPSACETEAVVAVLGWYLNGVAVPYTYGGTDPYPCNPN